ncbi:MAG: GntR family transcriptional regulator [Acidimicrobiales bacterium]|jgi:GntR family transcriptional regulator
MDMTTQGAMIHFRLDPRSGVPAYRQLVDQVRQAVRLGLLRPGDQLPPVREVVTQIAINPNTVHRAYRDLEAEGLVEGQQGRGTFVLEVPVPATTPERQAELQRELVAWLDKARTAGMDDEGILALVALSMRTKAIQMEEVAS